MSENFWKMPNTTLIFKRIRKWSKYHIVNKNISTKYAVRPGLRERRRFLKISFHIKSLLVGRSGKAAIRRGLNSSIPVS